MTDEPPKRRRWFQFRLRTLLIAVLVLSLPLSWFAWRREKARRQKKAVESIEKAGGIVSYQFVWKARRLEASVLGKTSSSWLRPIVGDDYFDHVESVTAAETEFSDDVLKHIGKLTSLHTLRLAHTQVTDAGLKHLKGLTRLEWLDLDKTQITDAGLEHLAGLTHLVMLYLGDTKVTNAGLEHLKGLTELRSLFLVDTQVTPEGVKKLQEALPNCNITY